MKYLLAALFLLVSSSIFSQALDKEEMVAQRRSSFLQNRLSFNIGLANPTGDFASTNILDINSGFAGPGLVIKANYGYMVNKNFGFTFDFTNANFPVESEEIEELTKNLYSGFATDLVYNVENYNLSQLTFGFILSIGNSTKFYINPVVGYSSFRFAEENISGVYTQNNIGAPVGASFSERVVGDNDEDVFIALNAGMDVPVSGNTYVNFNFQYYSTDYDFDGYLNYSDSQGNSGQIGYSFGQDVAAFHLGIGLAHYF